MEALDELEEISAASSAMIRHRMEALVELEVFIAGSSAIIYDSSGSSNFMHYTYHSRNNQYTPISTLCCYETRRNNSL